MLKNSLIFAFASIFSLLAVAQDSRSVDLNEIMKSPQNAPAPPSKIDSYRVDPPRTSADSIDLENFVADPVKPKKKVAPIDPGAPRPKYTPPIQTKLKMQFLSAMSEEKLQEMGDTWATEMKMSFHPSCGLSHIVGHANCSTFDKSCTITVVSQNCQIVDYSRNCPSDLRNAYLGRNNRDHKACVRLPETQASSPTQQRQNPVSGNSSGSSYGGSSKGSQ